MYACMNVCMYVYIDVGVYVCMPACMDVWMYVCMYACMHVYVCMHACLHVCMHACMHACVSLAQIGEADSHTCSGSSLTTTQISQKNLQKNLQKKKVDEDSNGEITVDEFLKFFQLANSPEVCRFSVYSCVYRLDIEIICMGAQGIYVYTDIM